MSLYYVFDLLLILLTIFLSYYSYQKRLYVKLFDYFKLFILITLSAKLASTTGVYLQKLSITKADSYAVLLLIAFTINFSFFYFGYNYFFKFINRYIDSKKLRENIAKVVTVIEVVIVITFLLYAFMQLHITKVYLYPIIKQSFSYSYIQSFYMHFLNDDFTHMILNSDSGVNHKEVLFNSFKKAF